MYMFIQYIEVVHVGHHHPLHFQDNIDVDIVDTVFQWKLAPFRKGEKRREKARNGEKRAGLFYKKAEKGPSKG